MGPVSVSQSGDPQHLVCPVDPVLPGLAGGEAGDTQGVLGVPGIRPHRGPGRSVAPRAGPEPVLAAARRAGTG